jgi:restriction endonuclease Mrr
MIESEKVTRKDRIDKLLTAAGWKIVHASSVNNGRIVLIDGKQLAQIDFDLGVSTSSKYEVKKVDHDYFGEE